MINERKYDFRVLYTSYFLISLARFLVMPIITFYCIELWQLTRGNDSSPTDIYQGSIHGFFYASFGISGIIFGPLSNNIGRRPIILFSLLGACIGLILQGISWNYWSFFVFRGLSGFVVPIAGVVQSVITDICEVDDLPVYTAEFGKISGLVELVGPVGALISPQIAALIFENVLKKDPPFKYRLVFFIGGILCLCGFIVAFTKLKESYKPNNGNKEDKEYVELIYTKEGKNGVITVLNLHCNKGDEMEGINIKFCVYAYDNSEKIVGLLLKKLNFRGYTVSHKLELEIMDILDEKVLNNIVLTPVTDNKRMNFGILSDVEVLHEVFESITDDDNNNNNKKLKREYTIIIIVTLFCVFLFNVTLMSHSTVYQWLNDGFHDALHWSSNQTAYSEFVYGLSLTLSNFIIPSLLDRLGGFVVFSIGSFTQALACVGILFTTKSLSYFKEIRNPWFEVALHTPWSISAGIGAGINTTISNYIIADLAQKINPKYIGFYLGCVTLTTAIGCFFTFILSLISTHINVFNTMYICAIIAVIVAIINLLLQLKYGNINITNNDDILKQRESLHERISNINNAGGDISQIRMSNLNLDSKIFNKVPRPSIEYPVLPNIVPSLPSSALISRVTQNEIRESVYRKSAINYQ